MSVTSSTPSTASPDRHSSAAFDFADQRPFPLPRPAGHVPQLRVEPAGVGDLPLIHRLLRSVFHGPGDAEFLCQQDDPHYRHDDRLLVKRSSHPVAHVRTMPREMWFRGGRLPVAVVCDLATAPEFRLRGLGSALLRGAEQRAEESGAALAVLRTRSPQFYQRRGYAVCFRHCFSVGGPRDVLARLAIEKSEAPRPTVLSGAEEGSSPAVRLWRYVELDALFHLYQDAAAAACGPLVRTDDYWQWLLSRRGFDRILVAATGDARPVPGGGKASVAGYAVTREGRIAELITAAGRADAARLLLARACGDAIERNHHAIRYDGPPGDPLHDLIRRAGGVSICHESERGEVFMAKILSLPMLLARLGESLAASVKSHGLEPPCELGLQLGGEKRQLVVGTRGAAMTSGKLGRSYLTLGGETWIQLLLGHLDVKQALREGRLAASTQVAVQTAAALFPRLPLWRPPLDELPSR